MPNSEQERFKRLRDRHSPLTFWFGVDAIILMIVFGLILGNTFDLRKLNFNPPST